mmetsp:Transcript_28649/g.93346  ORF Transcript_28649/g.93346 Transcript_28649/m.93346 type:complete len:349 (+) Transcript_28649:84-1130(+)
MPGRLRLLLTLTTLNGASTLRPVALYTSPVCLQHDPGLLRFGGHPESPARLEGLLAAMRGWVRELGENLSVRQPEADVTSEQLLRVHSEAHIRRVSDACTRAKRFRLPMVIDGDTIASPGTGAAAARAAGLVVAAVDDMCMGMGGAQAAGEPRRAFVMVRPPGHHAEPERPMGFCVFNNVMVGVAHARVAHDVQRIAVLDFDVHHGNGDAACAWSDPDVLYASSHQSPCYPGTGAAAGRAGRHGGIVNCPLPPGSGSAEFRSAWRETLLPAVCSFAPDAVFISAGFDAHAEDPLSSCRLSDADFAWITAEVAKIGRGALPIISVLEGGYNVERLDRSVRAHVKALIDA